MRSKSKKILVRVVPIVLALLLIFGGCAIYVSDYYRADLEAINAFALYSDVKETTLENRGIAYGEGNERFGLIFYPGGKVEYTAYAPLMRALASKGIFCVLLKMPFNLAVLDMNAADSVFAAYSEIGSWYIGGHSLGGSMAAYYVEGNPDRIEGLVLLGSYSSKDLSETNVRVLSIYGSEDKVLNREKYLECLENLPSSFVEIEIVGGCHAQFGMYGAQKGDGIPTVTAEAQIVESAEAIEKFIFWREN